MDLVLASVFGLAIGLSLGLLGAGGSILAVPALVYGLGLSPADAIPASLMVVGASAAGGAVTHLRAGRVRWATAVPFAAAGVVGSIAGTAVSRRLDPTLLLQGFAILMLVAGAAMLRRSHHPALAATDIRHAGPRSLVLALIAGVAVGFLTGLFGVGGGFMIVPPMVLLLGLPMPQAVATSLVVIVVNSAAALIAHLGAGATVHVAIVVTFVGAGMVGAVTGAGLGGRIPAGRLATWFAYVIFAVAVYVLIRTL